MTSTNTPAIERELDRFRSLDVGELRVEWRRLYHSEPPKISRDLLFLTLGYRLQEIEHGGLGKAIGSGVPVTFPGEPVIDPYLPADLDYRISQPGDSKAMIVCSCHVFDDEQLRSTIAKAPQRMRMSQIYASLGLSAQCGRCAHTIKRIKEQMSDYAITSADSNANLQARAR